MGTHSFSGIIHLAAISLDSWCAPKEVECRKVNEGGTRALMSQIDALRQKWRGEAPWVIHASSTDVFGPGRKEGERWPETALGRTKAAAEDVVEDISKQVGISATILRFADIYGYPQASSIPQSFIPSLLNNAVTSRPIQYSSDVAPMDLLHVDDAVEGILAAARRMEQKAGLPFKVEAIDLVSGKAWRAEELVERVRAETGSMSPIRDIGDHQPPPTRALRNSHAANILDWHPTITLDEGIRRSLLALAADIATYSRRYHSTHCEPSAEFPGPYGHTPKLTENERNKALWKLDGCTVNIGFEHAGWLHHLKCEDGKHCVADGEKVTALNWNSSVFVVRKVQNGLKERTARVMFEEEKGNGWLAVARDTREYGEVGLELCQKDGLQRADMEFDLEVRETCLPRERVELITRRSQRILRISACPCLPVTRCTPLRTSRPRQPGSAWKPPTTSAAGTSTCA
jgi:nucleoside-diphosphate-sugar epimerase